MDGCVGAGWWGGGRRGEQGRAGPPGGSTQFLFLPSCIFYNLPTYNNRVANHPLGSPTMGRYALCHLARVLVLQGPQLKKPQCGEMETLSQLMFCQKAQCVQFLSNLPKQTY